ncbi:MAG: 30S ribosomal protein S20 [Synergistaceae bacterium]|nr:30S ribosomal protein S20 [Bacilli bacterium]MDD3689875.1 30S ribosomal protein S20 [Synergistaceae bacterium]MDD4076508.1 30S ribosomal protein S20 [Bacilli bacterium]MDD4387612.1 30S ribosomal protein S20 [Bacilli bacterium]
MANIKQQAKRIITNEKRRQRNISFKSSAKTAMKKVEAAVKDNNYEEALKAYQLASKKLDKALAKGIYHKNFVSRNKSKLAKMINTIA